MYTKILTQTDTSTIVTLEQAKANLNIDVSFTVDDDLIQSMIDASVQLAQKYTVKLLTTGQVKLEADQQLRWVDLPYGNVSTVTEVLVDDVATTDFTFSDVTQRLKIGSSVTSFSNIKVTYDCGYAETPIEVKRGILIMVNTFYTHRDSFVLGYNVNETPLTAQKVLNAVKDWRF